MNKLLTNLQSNIINTIKANPEETPLRVLWIIKYLLDDAIRAEQRNRRIAQLNINTLRVEATKFLNLYHQAVVQDTSVPVYVETTFIKEYTEAGLSLELIQQTLQPVIELDTYQWLLDDDNYLCIKSQHDQYAKWVTIGDITEDLDTRETFVSLQRIEADLYILNTTQPDLSTEYENEGEQIGTYHYQYLLIPSTKYLKRI